MCIYIQRYSQLTSTTTDRNCVRGIIQFIIVPESTANILSSREREKPPASHALSTYCCCFVCVTCVKHWLARDGIKRQAPPASSSRCSASCFPLLHGSTARWLTGWLAGWFQSDRKPQPTPAAATAGSSTWGFLSVCVYMSMYLCVCVCSARRITLIYTHAEKFNPNVI